MEPLTKEDLSDVPEEEEITKEDLSDVSEEEETLSKPNVVTGKDFAKLVKKAGKLGAANYHISLAVELRSDKKQPNESNNMNSKPKKRNIHIELTRVLAECQRYMNASVEFYCEPSLIPDFFVEK
ncbi:unnamed protein product [Porites lobata]|uniref:Uncharacterized protein n=1 Tax=Porites lobata TaxID=104759 RepID=A0ABN8RV51_9CNID|nr:unnamed protein product [Porites lobata]